MDLDVLFENFFVSVYNAQIFHAQLIYVLLNACMLSGKNSIRPISELKSPIPFWNVFLLSLEWIL